MKRNTGAVALALALVLALTAAAVQAQNYPTRPVRMLVPLAAGGGMDTVTRGLALQMTDSRGQPGRARDHVRGRTGRLYPHDADRNHGRVSHAVQIAFRCRARLCTGIA